MWHYQKKEMTRSEFDKLFWWEKEKFYTEKDKAAISAAIYLDWTEIDPDTAETDAGRYQLEDIQRRKYHHEEFLAGIL